MNFDPFNDPLRYRELALEDELSALNTLPKINPSMQFGKGDSRWFIQRGRSAHFVARGASLVNVLPRLVCFHEPRQSEGVGLAEHFGTFLTTRTFSALEDYTL